MWKSPTTRKEKWKSLRENFCGENFPILKSFSAFSFSFSLNFRESLGERSEKIFARETKDTFNLRNKKINVRLAFNYANDTFPRTRISVRFLARTHLHNRFVIERAEWPYMHS